MNKSSPRLRAAPFGLLSRTLFSELFTSATLGTVLFASIVFLELAKRLFELLVSNSPPRTVAYLFALVLPQALTYAIPLGVLVGTLITLSRMSADGEITAMRAAGVPGRRVAPPILAFGFLAMCAAAASSLWLTPWSIRESYRVFNQLIANQLTADVQPRVFEEQFPNKILYVSDVERFPTSTARWHRIFMADITPPEERKPSETDRGDTPEVTLASEALATPDAANNRIQLALIDESIYTAGHDEKYAINDSTTSDQLLQAQRPDEKRDTHPVTEMDTLPLYRLAYRNKQADKLEILQARIELHQRFAFPMACVLLALTAIPLGITARRSGKSSAVVLTVAIAFIYDMGMISLIKLAGQGAIPVAIAVWTPNFLFSVFGVTMLARLELPGDRDLLGRFTAFFRSLGRSRDRVPGIFRRLESRSWMARFPLFVQVVDTYILSSFLFYFALWLVSIVLMYDVYQFFVMLNDMIKNHSATAVVLRYFFFLTPRLVYEFTPVAAMAAVLVVLGVLAKNNEITAFKACGISLYRLAAPVLLAGFFLSGSLFAFDHYWVPEADRQQDALYNEIKGKPTQTFLQADRKWIYGLHDRVYYYKYFDPKENVMGSVSVFEIDPKAFRLKKHIYADRARWNPRSNQWEYQNGWSRDINGHKTVSDLFPNGTRTFPELDETPDYFVKQDVQSQQMNFQELEAYIAELNVSGFNTKSLQVDLHEKFSKPLFALILAMVSVPFSFLAGNRGAMRGVGVSLFILIAYRGVGNVFAQVGDLGQLSPAVAAWSPDVIFALFGLYFLARMRT